MLIFLIILKISKLLFFLVFVFIMFRQRHSEGYCAMYEICGNRSDGKVLNCPYGSPAVKVRLLITVSHKFRTNYG